MIPYKQLSLADIFEDCQNIFDSDTPKFLTLWENHINDASKITRFTQDFLDDLKIVNALIEFRNYLSCH